MSFSCFQVVQASASPADAPVCISVIPAPDAPMFSIENYDPGHATSEDLPTQASNPVGSFSWDRTNGYTMLWDSFDDMLAWRRQEQKSKTIELRQKHRPKRSSAANWCKKYIYVCARAGTGGKSKYTTKHSRKRKVSTKRTGCTCRLTVKTYPGTSQVLGRYTEEHSHPVGDKNLIYTRLTDEDREEIEHLLRLGVQPNKVLKQIQGKIYSEGNLHNLRSEQARRNHFATRADIRRIQKTIEEETIRLASGDGGSVLEWVEKLRSQGHFVSLKRSDDPAPPGSKIAEGAFVLIIQTEYQRECWQEHGDRFAGLDATHNTTHYENMSLFTLLTRDRWGRGMPVAFMISSNATEVTIDYFLMSIRSQSPDIHPNKFMTDFDHAQINAMKHIFPESQLYLCWWHVLHAWQQHFCVTAFPELWVLLKSWIRIKDEADFWAQWQKIQDIAPASVIAYLKTYWLNVRELWSAVFRQDRSVFELCDTNMLVEAWHHLLKGDFLEGKRNRRLDHLIYVLVCVAVPYFIQRHRRQELGFEGPDLELRRRIEVNELAKSIPKTDIRPEENQPAIFTVQSQSQPDVRYRVDIDAYDCDCLDFPAIHFCKHIAATQKHFPDDSFKLPVLALQVPQSALTNDVDSESSNVSGASDSGSESGDDNDDLDDSETVDNCHDPTLYPTEPS